MTCIMSRVKLLTLCIPERRGSVLLGMKKRGFGEGFWNGFGGKVESGETIERAMERELREEAVISAKSYERRGVLTFEFDNRPELMEVHVFHVSDFEGNPTETEEMRPKWFKYSEIPYDTMWQDDKIWYPIFLEGKKFTGKFNFVNTVEMVKHEIDIVDVLPQHSRLGSTAA